jgi:hypothetical protein
MILLNVTEHLHAFMRQLFGRQGERGITGVAPVGRSGAIMSDRW